MLQFISGVGTSNQSKINKYVSSFFHMLNLLLFSEIFIGFDALFYICSLVQHISWKKSKLLMK